MITKYKHTVYNDTYYWLVGEDSPTEKVMCSVQGQRFISALTKKSFLGLIKVGTLKKVNSPKKPNTIPKKKVVVIKPVYKFEVGDLVKVANYEGVRFHGEIIRLDGKSFNYDCPAYIIEVTDFNACNTLGFSPINIHISEKWLTKV